jgi:predicted ester cyclase
MSDTLQAVGLVIALAAPSSGAKDNLSVDQAVEIVRPIYNALTAASPGDVRVHLESGTTKDWQNCGSTNACDGREATVTRWSARIAKAPDFRFEIRDVVTMGNRIVVRSEAQGTPVGELIGVAQSGRTFRIMTIDIHEVEDGKVSRTYHVEDWSRAAWQLIGEE